MNVKRSEVVLEARRFQVVRKTVERPDGTAFVHDSVKHPGAVVILPWVDADHVCLISNFRAAVERTLIELPAGTLAPDEEPLAAAHRELAEETGYTAGRMLARSSFFMSPGILHERMHFFEAGELTDGPSRLEADEEIQRLVVPWKEALAMAKDGRIEDAKTLIALLSVERDIRQ